MATDRGMADVQMRPLVAHADSLLKWAKKVFGKTIVNGIIRHTFFHQFCAGKGLPLASHMFFPLHGSP